MAVVDERLRVRGIESLRVVDASIMPALPSCGPAPAVFMIGEKGGRPHQGRPVVRRRVCARRAAVHSLRGRVSLRGSELELRHEEPALGAL